MSSDHTIDVGHVHVLTEPGSPCRPDCPHPSHHRLTDEQVRWHADPEYRRRNARLSLTAEQYQREQDALAAEVLEHRQRRCGTCAWWEHVVDCGGWCDLWKIEPYADEHCSRWRTDG